MKNWLARRFIKRTATRVSALEAALPILIELEKNGMGMGVLRIDTLAYSYTSHLIYIHHL